MSRRRRSVGAAPPEAGLPPAVAVHRWTRTTAVGSALYVLAVLAVEVHDAEVRWLDPVTLAPLVGCPLLVGVSVARHRVLAGSGWLSVRLLWGPEQWVRTDRLVRLWSRQVRYYRYLHLRDDAGREVVIDVDLLRWAPTVRDQLALDVARSQARELASGCPLEADRDDIALLGYVPRSRPRQALPRRRRKRR